MSDSSTLSDDGYLGSLTYQEVKYDIYVRGYEKIYTFLQFPVYKVNKIEIISPETGNLKIKSILQRHFEQNGMYCSVSPKLCSIDFTKNEPSQLLMWNYKLQNYNWYCIFGYIYGPLVCRRLTGYQGKRFLRRGILKDKGQVANELFVQLIQTNNKIIRILRGCAAVQFTQQPCMSRKPRILVPYQQNQLGVYLNRIQPIINNTPIIFISLIDNQQDEYKVAQEQLRQFHLELLKNNLTYHIYEIFPNNEESNSSNSISECLTDSTIQSKHPIPALTNLKLLPRSQILPYTYGIVIMSTQYAFIHIDFHSIRHKRSNARFMDDVVQICEHYYGKDGFIPRINCIDSLDRTNATISCFLKSLCQVQIIIDAGNIISRQYASSDAMKQDIAEYGIRTWKGRFQDLKSVIQRYFMNNLHDEYIQDGYRLVMGEYGDTNPEEKIQPVYINFYVFTSLYLVVTIIIDIIIGIFAKYAAIGVIVFTILAIGVYICIIRLCGKHFVARGYVK